MKKIKLSGKLGKNLYTIVDDEDFCKLNKLKWHYNSSGYATNHKGDYIRMHRLIMNATKGMEVDHINGNRLDNRKCNLRICTRSQNIVNKNIGIKYKTSIYKGVSANGEYWTSQITTNGKSFYLGSFKSQHLAALMYDFWAPYFYGSFTKPNFKLIKSSFATSK